MIRRLDFVTLALIAPSFAAVAAYMLFECAGTAVKAYHRFRVKCLHAREEAEREYLKSQEQP